MKTLVKTSIKLLFRSKAFWFFLVLMPMLSTFILTLKFDSSAAFGDGNEEKIIELANADEKVAYRGGKGEYLIKVYDASGSDLSEYFLQKICDSGMFLVHRADLTKDDIKDQVNEEFITDHIEKDGYEDRMGVAIYLTPDFDTAVLDGDYRKALTIYVLSKDSRTEVLEDEIAFQLSRIKDIGTIDALEKVDEYIPEKTIETVAGGDGRNLTTTQINQKTQMGYAFSFLTLGFVFCGIFVAHASIKEQKNGVLTRINLTKAGTLQYFVSKFITGFVIAVMFAAVESVCSIMLDFDDLGMNRFKFIGMIFLMGLIFSSLSMLIGILLGDIMSSNVAAFTIWCMSALLSGLYFPLNYTSNALKVLSFLMPQKWFVTGAEMIFVGDNNAFPMLICITAAYLAVIISLGSLGLKIRRTDSWGNS